MIRTGILAVSLCAVCAFAGVPLPEDKNILVILSDDLSLPAVAQYYNALEAALEQPDPSAVNVYTEMLDVSRFHSADYPAQLAKWSIEPGF